MIQSSATMTISTRPSIDLGVEAAARQFVAPAPFAHDAVTSWALVADALLNHQPVNVRTFTSGVTQSNRIDPLPITCKTDAPHVG